MALLCYGSGFGCGSAFCCGSGFSPTLSTRVDLGWPAGHDVRLKSDPQENGQDGLLAMTSAVTEREILRESLTHNKAQEPLAPCSPGLPWRSLAPLLRDRKLLLAPLFHVAIEVEQAGESMLFQS